MNHRPLPVVRPATTRRARPQGRHRERGMVTAELAVSLLSAALVVATGCWVVGLVVVQEACRSTAAQIARQMARGDEAAAQEARRRGPGRIEVTVDREQGWVKVSVATQRSLGRLGPVRLQGSAAASMEPGLAGQ